ncbi:MAG: redoxin domain-containing protein [Planctomycetes bacterium]|nr:redoxin domain-containing protein [Planctomycetota bacterium]
MLLRFAAVCVASLSACLAAAAWAADEGAASDAGDAASGELAAGHSQHGEVFNEGPRQKAYLMDGTGNVRFPVTTDSELAQKFIEQGVGQLHGFWYFEAERSFRHAATLDPDCAIAYWGMAMANTGNEKRAKGFIAEATQRKEAASPRERAYIDALDAYLKADSKKKKERAEAWMKALERISYDHPEDIEAKALLGLAMWQHRSNGVPITSYLALDALLNDVLEVNPLHPCHHYRIHLWDYEKPERALNSAALCGKSAPAIAHMWHMPGHIYSRLKRYNDAVWQQEASARVDHAHMIRDRVLPDQIHNFAHNNEWLIRNLIFTGRARDAVDLAKNMLELPRHPKHNTVSKRNSSSNYGRARLFQALDAFEMWDELIALAETYYLEPTEKEAEQIKRLRYLGRAYLRSGHSDAVAPLKAELESLRQKIQAARDEAVSKAVEKANEEGKGKIARNEGESEEAWTVRVLKEHNKAIEKARADAARPFDNRLKPIVQALDEFQAIAAAAEGRYKDAYELLKKAGVDTMERARAQFLAGEVEAALKAASDEVGRHKNETLPLARLIDLRWQAGRRDKAKQAFESLREISGPIDLAAPPFARLAPIAKELGYSDDWRVPLKRPEDFGERPPLDELGPFRWRPSPAEAWTLNDVAGEEHALSDFRGRPLVIIFYLGHGCLHCAEQLQAFAPKAGEFSQNGIELVAISTDDPSELQKSLDNYKQGEFPFPLVSDVDLVVFKAYRAYDDFEDQPLHGTFLIDAEGLVRWHDISYEPFMQPEFVLKETQRLFGRNSPGSVQTARTAP